MRKEDLTLAAIFLEAVGIIFSVIYIALQIYYGLAFHIAPYKYILNLIILILVYLGLTLLSNYPERINNLPPEVCVGKIRKYSIRMLRLVKFVFITGLLIPCVCDAFGIEILNAYSFLVVLVIVVIAGFYEYKILREIKNLKGQ